MEKRPKPPKRLTLAQYFERTPIERRLPEIGGLDVTFLPTILDELRDLIAFEGAIQPDDGQAGEHFVALIRNSADPDSVVAQLPYSQYEDTGLYRIYFVLPGVDEIN